MFGDTGASQPTVVPTTRDVGRSLLRSSHILAATSTDVTVHRPRRSWLVFLFPPHSLVSAVPGYRLLLLMMGYILLYNTGVELVEVYSQQKWSVARYL